VKSSTWIALGLVVTLGACSTVRDSRLNPFNWFGGSQSQKTTTAQLGANERADGRVLIDQLLSMRVNRTPGGAVIEVVGRATTQGYWKAELVALNEGRAVDGMLSYEFRVAKSRVAWPQGAEQTREIVVAKEVSQTRLQSVRQIRVIAARNTRTSRR